MLTRKRMLHTFKVAQNVGPYDELPVLPAEVDPQLHLSCNAIPQPFWLVCEKDCVLVQMKGFALVHMKHSPTTRFKMRPGDFVYVPGGIPHRLVPDGATIVYRYKARNSGREATAWYCESCGERLAHFAWDTATELPQEGYLRMCTRYNKMTALRTCNKCGHLHQPIDLTPFRWRELAEELRSASDMS